MRAFDYRPVNYPQLIAAGHCDSDKSIVQFLANDVTSPPNAAADPGVPKITAEEWR
jgi:hypothetical protein